MKRTSKRTVRRDEASRSSINLGFGVAGLALVALGAVLPNVTGTLAFSLLLLPAGTLTLGGVGLLQKEKPLSPAVVSGMVMIGLGVVCLAVLAFFTAEPFSGLRIDDGRRRFRVPIWHELLAYHLMWTVVALVVTVGVHLVGRSKIERDIGVGLALFATFPLIGLLAWLLQGSMR